MKKISENIFGPRGLLKKIRQYFFHFSFKASKKQKICFFTRKPIKKFLKNIVGPRGLLNNQKKKILTNIPMKKMSEKYFCTKWLEKKIRKIFLDPRRLKKKFQTKRPLKKQKKIFQPMKKNSIQHLNVNKRLKKD